jgi:hypothetical protein
VYVILQLLCWRTELAQDAKEMDNGLRKETKSGWKESTTLVLRKEVATTSRRREKS